jgi:hypothetical protein
MRYRYGTLMGFLVVVILAVCVPSLMAQTAGTGALIGTVTDPTGAVIPNVTVTVTSETGQERSTTTGADGTYRFTFLPPSNYRVRFTAAGFKVLEVASFKVNATETPVLDRSLEVGAQAEQVTVEANVETVQTASSTLGTVVQGQTATALPLTTRNYTNLLGLSAGAIGSVNNASGFGKGGMEIATNGGTQSQNNFQMDGVSMQGGNGVVTQGFYLGFAIPNPDTLQEFKIQTSLYDAGYGRNPGANVNVVTKSGTNAFHGTAFEFFRNTALNATDFFRNRQCGVTPMPLACFDGTKARVKQTINQNQFGGTFGGPIIKDKLFFFTSYQQTWQKNGAAPQGFSSGITLVPIPGGPRGTTSLSGINDAQASTFQQALGQAFCNSPTNPGGAGAGQGMQVACDGSNINPYAMRFLQAKLDDGSYYIPGSGTAGNLPGVTYTRPAYEKEYQGMLNLDWAINQKHTLSSRYFHSKEPQTINFFGAASLPGNSGNSLYGYQTGVMRLTSILSNSIVNELRGSVLRSITDQTQNPPATTWADKIYPNCAGNVSNNQLNTTGGPISSLGDPTKAGLPVCVTPGHGLVGGSTPMPPQLSFQGLFLAYGGTNDVFHHATTLGFGDQLSWTRGKHSLRFGGEWEAMRWVWVGSWLSHGIMAFQTFSDFLIGLPGGCGTAVKPGDDPARPLGCNGSGFSNVLNTNNFVVASGPSGLVHGYRMKNADWYVQDDFKVNSRLTLNLGLRWEYAGRLSDKYGNLVSFWPSAIRSVSVPGSSPATGTYAGWVVPSNYDTAYWGNPPAGVINSGRKVATSPTPLDNFAPRVGFAWRPFDSNRFVVRGGGGFFYDRVPVNTEVHAVEESPPYGFKLDQGPSTNQFSSLARPFQDWRLGTFPIRWVDFANNRGSDITEPTLGDLFLTPLVYSWNLNFQYEFMPRWVLEFGYVGSKGIHLGQWLHMVNVPGLATAANPINGVTTNTVANARLRAPLLGASVTGYQLGDTIGDMKFNSFQATLRKQLSHGLTFQAAYTFSRAFTTQNGPGAGPNLGNPLDTRQQYGLNAQYRPHRMVINYNYEIPGKNLKGVAGAILGGWALSGVTTIQSGQWMSILDTRGGGIYGMAGAIPNVNSRAQIAPGKTYAEIPTPGPIGQRLGGATGGCGYFYGIYAASNPCSANAAFTLIPNAVAPNGTVTNGTDWGNSGVGVIEGPPQFNFDTSLIKNTRVGGIREDATLQFRAEFFNLFNHPQFGNQTAGGAAAAPFINNLALGNFGQITATSVNPRLIQFALKYVF